MADPDLSAIPREHLGTLPTPLVAAPRLSEELGIEIWFKRDDLTGIGLGGNKVRPLEFLLGDALVRGCDVLVTGSGPQSNWSMLAALAARRCGLDSVVCFYGDAPPTVQGNLLLHSTIGTTVQYTGDPSRATVDALIEVTSHELRAAGRNPAVLPRGGATSRGAIGYVAAALELREQTTAAGLANPTLWMATGSCGTQAGLVAAVAAGILPEVIGVTVSRTADECRERVLALATGTAELIGTPTPHAAQVNIVDGWIGPGYGYASAEGKSAADLVARSEALFLDPPFCAKAMAALVFAASNGDITGPVVFLVSGGAPTLFVQDGDL